MKTCYLPLQTQSNKHCLENHNKHSFLENIRVRHKSETNYSFLLSSFGATGMDVGEQLSLEAADSSQITLSIGSWGQSSFQVANSNSLLRAKLDFFFF